MLNQHDYSLLKISSLYQRVGKIFPFIDFSKINDEVYFFEYLNETLKECEKFPQEFKYFITQVLGISSETFSKLSGQDLYQLFPEAIKNSQILLFKRVMEEDYAH